VEHVVEARRAPDLGGGQPKELGDVLYSLWRQVPVLFLDEVQYRYEGRALLRVERDQCSRTLQDVFTEMWHG
jgi:hypothetical protein